LSLIDIGKYGDRVKSFKGITDVSGKQFNRFSSLDDAKALNTKIPFKRWTFHLLNKPFSVLGFSARKETYICYC